jgi:hypothetical protein
LSNFIGKGHVFFCSVPISRNDLESNHFQGCIGHWLTALDAHYNKKTSMHKKILIFRRKKEEENPHFLITKTPQIAFATHYRSTTTQYTTNHEVGDLLPP